MRDLTLYLELENHLKGGMSEFQMSHFVIDDHITPYRKLRQAVIEAKSRLETITSHGFDLEELQLKRERAVSDRNVLAGQIEGRLADVQVRRCDFEIDRKSSTIKQLESEADFFLRTIDALLKELNITSVDQIREKLSDGKFVAEGEHEFWHSKLARSAACDYLAIGSISKGLLETIVSLPEQSQKQIAERAECIRQAGMKSLASGRDQALVGMD